MSQRQIRRAQILICVLLFLILANWFAGGVDNIIESPDDYRLENTTTPL